MSDETQVRNSPPSGQPNNQDVFIWALYLLGGSDQDVDVEEIYLKCFELAPARLGWRTRPEIPDYKKISKALQSVEAKTHVGLVHKVNEYKRRLTPVGVRWIDNWISILEKTYSGSVSASKSHNQYEMLRSELKQSQIWKQFVEGNRPLDLSDLASAIQLTAASPKSTWLTRINNLARAADVLDDSDLKDFSEYLSQVVEERVIG
jgi:hypothetical protein